MKLIGFLNRDMRLPGETLAKFAAEYRKLTPEDVSDLRQWYEEAGEHPEE